MQVRFEGASFDNFAVPGHDSRLGQVISNLLSNACSFSPEGGVVRVTCRRVRTEVEIVVDDEGPGIRADALERIFERFYTDRPHQGFGQNSGLGLSISKQIVEAHGGKIWAENRLGDADAGRRGAGARRALRGPAAGDMTGRDRARIGRQAGEVGILIRGPSGAGKSRLAFDLILAGRAGQIPPTQLVGDDRLLLAAEDGRLVVRPAAELEGLIEIRGLGIRRCDFVCAGGGAAGGRSCGARRRPHAGTACACMTRYYGIKIPRIPVGAGFDALPLVTAALLTRPLSATPPAAFRRLPEGNW